MLAIRKQQIEVFTEAAAKAFEDRTYRHLQQWFPRHITLLGEDRMRRLIRHGWEKADSYHLTAECCVRSYIEFMCLLGSGFDADPLLPWAVQILRDPSTEDQVVRADRLYDKVWHYIDHIARDYRDGTGQPTTARFVGELRQLRQESDAPLTPPMVPDFLTALQVRLKRIFPHKCAYVGGENVRQAITGGVDAAKTYGITTQRGAIVFTAMRFVLGGSFDDDLLLPWASAALTDRAIGDQFKRVDTLYAEGVSFLRHWWDSATGEVS